MPHVIKKVVIDWLGFVMFCCRRKKTKPKAQAVVANGKVVENGIVMTKTEESPTEEEIADDQEEIYEERRKAWMKVVRVVDRLCFIVFLLVFLITVLAVFLRAPRFHDDD